MSILIFVFGIVIGSFLSVCIYRIPYSPSVGLSEEELKGNIDPESILSESAAVVAPAENRISINFPRRSICPKCDKQLLWWHNIPLVSWCILRGKCAFCKAPISARYPAVEIITGLLAVLSYQTFDPYTAILTFAVACALVVISFIDYDFYIIPNMISIPGTVLGFVVAVINNYYHIFSRPITTGLWDSFFGLAFGAGFLLIVSEFYFRVRKQDGLGMGDVKLLALVGAFLGSQAALFTIFVGSLLGTVGGVLLMLLARRKLTHPLPFGPYLALATLIHMYCSNTTSVVLFPDITPLIMGH